MARITAALLTLFIAACTTSPQQLRESADISASFEIDRNYQPVYRAVLTRARGCLQNVYVIVQGDLYHDIRAGEIGAVSGNMLGADTILTIDVRAQSDTRTKVTTYVRHRVYESVPALVTEWANERSAACPIRPASA